jgi:hypothetical protein
MVSKPAIISLAPTPSAAPINSHQHHAPPSLHSPVSVSSIVVAPPSNLENRANDGPGYQSFPSVNTLVSPASPSIARRDPASLQQQPVVVVAPRPNASIAPAAYSEIPLETIKERMAAKLASTRQGAASVAAVIPESTASLSIDQLQATIADLKQKKSAAVEADDLDLAKALKDELATYTTQLNCKWEKKSDTRSRRRSWFKCTHSSRQLCKRRCQQRRNPLLLPPP